ncbi:hypothetical protein A2U01_0102279, partial [Trifolium medium]|nr:hypothetical protein [Trifolium medium]
GGLKYKRTDPGRDMIWRDMWMRTTQVI